MKKAIRKLCSIALSLVTAGTVMGTCMSNADVSIVNAANLLELSTKYKTADNGGESEYYRKLKNTVYDINNSSVSYMEATARIAESQVGYKAYGTNGMFANLHLNGAYTNSNFWGDTANTEYTRWIYDKVAKLELKSSVVANNKSAYNKILNNCNVCRYADVDWCAAFASWCMYHSGYHYNNSDKYIVYSVCADPRKDLGPGERITSFNGNVNKVWYTKKGNAAINEVRDWYTGSWSGIYMNKNFKEWNKGVASSHRNRSQYPTSVDKNGIPYKRGGLIFFNYDGDVLLDHVGIVVSVGKNSLTYIDGNGGNGLEVAKRTVKYSENKIGAYMEF